MEALGIVNRNIVNQKAGICDTAIVIDDNPMELLVTKTILKRKNFSKKLVTFQAAKTALSYFKRAEERNSFAKKSDIVILLDLYMPKMDGFEFVNSFEKLTEDFKKKFKIYILSNSTNPLDLLKASSSSTIYGFISKPSLSSIDLSVNRKSC